MPERNKVGTSLLISPHMFVRAQALAIVRDESIAEVLRIALEGSGVAAMEAREAGKLNELREALKGMRVPYDKGVEEMVRARPRIRFAELFDQAAGTPLAHFPYREGPLARA